MQREKRPGSSAAEQVSNVKHCISARTGTSRSGRSQIGKDKERERESLVDELVLAGRVHAQRCKESHRPSAHASGHTPARQPTPVRFCGCVRAQVEMRFLRSVADERKGMPMEKKRETKETVDALREVN